MKKKLLSYFLSLALILTAIPFTNIISFAVEYDFGVDGDYEYEVIDGTATITMYYGSETDLVIPSTLDSYTVTEIGQYAFGGTEIETVKVPSSVIAIGYGAFDSCENLKTVTLAEGLDTIADYGFYGCSNLETINIPSTVTYIGGNAFNGCSSLQEITLPSNLKTLGTGAFAKSGLTSIVIPNSIRVIKASTFQGCSNLASVTVPSTVYTVENKAFQDCTSLVEITFPEKVFIDSNVFNGCTNLKKVVLKAGSGGIMSNAIPASATIYAPSGTYADTYATDNGNELIHIDTTASFSYSVISETKKTINIIGLKSGTTVPEHLIIPAEIDGYTVTTIQQNAFRYEDTITSVVIPSTITTIGQSAFYDCDSLESITIPGNVSTINVGTFMNCSKLKEVIIQNGVTSINYWAFAGCTSLEKVVIAGSVKSISYEVFSGCSSLTDVTFGEGVQTIGAELFKNCTNLKEVTFPASLSSLEYDIFTGCTAIENFYIAEGNKKFSAENGILYNADKTELIKCIIQKGDTLEIPNTVKTIGTSSLEGCSRFKEIIIPSSVTVIMNNAFSGCSGLTEITIPATVTTLYSGIFKNCTSLKTVHYLTTKDIPDSGFMNCTALENITIPEGVTCVNYGAFSGCSSLKEITIPSTVTTIAGRAFKNCTSLEKVVIKDGVTSIVVYVFEGCTNLKTIVIPASVTSDMKESFEATAPLTIYGYAGSTAETAAEYYGFTFIDIESVGDKFNCLIDGHNFGEWQAIQYATCEQVGINQRTCGTCGETEEEIIPKKLDHAFDEQEFVPPTCTSDGYLTMKCWICGFTDTIGEYEATGHTDNNANGYCDSCDEFIATASGTCGDNLTWTFDEETGTLTISGEGAMYDYLSSNRPWEDYEDQIKEVVIGDGVSSIGNNAFYSFGTLTTITISDTVESIGYYGFYGCTKLTSITLPDNVTSIGYNAFTDCTSLTNVIIPNGVTTISSSLFSRCTGLTSVTIPNSVTTISSSAFSGCRKLTGITIPNSVTSIGSSTFKNCSSLTNITIPDSVTSIGEDVFFQTNLESISIGKGLTNIGKKALYGCPLTSVTVDSDNQHFSNDENGVLFNKDKTKLIQYPVSNTRTNYAIPDSVTSIEFSAFASCKYLTDVTIPDSVTKIGQNAFEFCRNLTSVTISKNIDLIDVAVFYGCENLTSVTIPNGVSKIDNYAFYGCYNLASVIISNNVTTISSYAFYNCIRIADVYYYGTEEQWNSITVGSSNDSLLNATIHYNCTPPFTGIKDDYFYIDDVKQMAYQLVEIDDDFYYIGDCNRIVKSKRVYITAERANGLTFADGTPITAGWYEFDENGKMILFSGIIDDYAYVSGVKLMAYQLVEIDGDFYYIGDCNKIVKSKRVYITTERANGLTFADDTPITAGWYEFDADGKMILFSGIIDDYAYVSGVKLMAYQLVEIDGYFYYVGDCNKIVKSKRVYVTTERANGLTFADGTPITAGWYEFDENGKMILFSGIIDDYAYVSGVKLMAYQLVEIDGDFYYVGDCNKIVKSKRVYVTTERANGLTFADGTAIEAGWYNFDADGKMITE